MTCRENGAVRPMTTQDSYVVRLIFICGFLLFFPIALVASALGCHWRNWLPGAEGVNSLMGGVKAAVYTFMAHLQ